ncbi:MAG: hypothetical protein JNM66_09790 [Bryobacterales bacterium]|nr:hypothetical protein [Bryobacterales bacterium]
MRAICSYLITISLGVLMAQPPGPIPPISAPAAASPAKPAAAAATPVIPAEPGVQIVAEPVCHTVTEGLDAYRRLLNNASLTVPDPCALPLGLAAAIDRDLQKPAGMSGNGLAAVTELVNTVMNKDPRFGKSFGALVHLVRYEDPKAGAEAGVERDVWLACNRGGTDPMKRDRLVCGTNVRLYGRRNVAVLFIHTNIEFSLTPNADLARTPNATAGRVAYYGSAKKKLPVPLENLQGLLQIAGAMAAGAAPRVALLGHGFFHEMPLPSNVTVTGARKTADGVTRVGAKTELVNEGFYFVDFTLGVPLSKLTAVEFVDASKSFQPKTVNRQSAYGMASLYFLPVDLSAGTRRYWMPRAVFGVGVTGKLGHNFMIGGALGLPSLQFFVGSEFAKPNDAQRAAGVADRFRSRVTFGLNIPVMSAIQKLKAKTAEQ